MKYLSATLFLLIAITTSVFARAGATSQDKFLVYIPVGILLLIWGIPKLRGWLRSKKDLAKNSQKLFLS